MKNFIILFLLLAACSPKIEQSVIMKAETVVCKGNKKFIISADVETLQQLDSALAAQKEMLSKFNY